jgi:hypothetical protein
MFNGIPVRWIERPRPVRARQTRGIANRRPIRVGRFAMVRGDALLNRCDIALLRAAFQESSAQPVREFPHLGPIHFEPR